MATIMHHQTIMHAQWPNRVQVDFTILLYQELIRGRSVQLGITKSKVRRAALAHKHWWRFTCIRTIRVTCIIKWSRHLLDLSRSQARSQEPRSRHRGTYDLEQRGHLYIGALGTPWWRRLRWSQSVSVANLPGSEVSHWSLFSSSLSFLSLYRSEKIYSTPCSSNIHFHCNRYYITRYRAGHSHQQLHRHWEHAASDRTTSGRVCLTRS